MTFFKFTAPQTGQSYNYPTLGFKADDGAVLDGTASTPAITNPPDGNWAVVGAGPESGITRYGNPTAGTDYSEPQPGTMLSWDDAANNYLPTAPSQLVSSDHPFGAQLNAAFARSALNAVTSGNVPSDGVTNCDTAIAAAQATARNFGLPLYFPAGTYQIAQTIVLGPGDGLLRHREAKFLYTGNGTAVQLTQSVSCADIFVERAGFSGGGSTTGWINGSDTSSVGVEMLNINNATVSVSAQGFETGLLLRGQSGGTAYNTIFIERIRDNKRNIRFAGDGSTGWANQNTFIGGNVRHDSNYSAAGTVGIDLSVTGNGNTFIGTSLEGSVTETVVSIHDSFNSFINCRYEQIKNGSFKFLDTSQQNTVIGGDGNTGPSAAMFSNAGQYNRIIGTLGTSGYGSTSGAAYEAHTVTSDGNSAFSAYCLHNILRWSVNAAGTESFYNDGDSFPRIQIAPAGNPISPYGGITAGRGVVAPDAAIARSKSASPAWITQGAVLRRVKSVSLSANGALALTPTDADTIVVNLGASATSTTLPAPATDSINSGATQFTAVVTLELVQDATGGRTWVAPTNVAWAGGSAPVLSTEPNVRDVFTLRYDSTLSKWIEQSRSTAVA